MTHSNEIMLINVVLPEAEREALVDKYCNFITEKGGRIIRREYWGVKRLAYDIGEHTSADYHLVEFIVDSMNTLKELDGNIKKDLQVLRHMIIRKGE